MSFNIPNATRFVKIKLASKLPAGQTYAVFRKGIVPDWEDAANKDGGRWLLHYEKRERAARLDERWMEVLLMTLGNHLNSAVTGRSAFVTYRG